MVNPYIVFILSILGFVFFLDLTTDFLNLKNLKQELPTEFKNLYPSDKYANYLQYQADQVYFEFFHRTFFFAATLIFIFKGGFNSIDLFARSFKVNTIETGLIFAGTLGALQTTIQLPFSLFSTFKIEEKYGFNKTTLTTFFSDLIKGITLGTVLGGLIFAGMIYFFENTGDYAWIYAWLAITAFQMILIYLAPAFILPLFNRFQPLEPGPLRQAIEDYAKTRRFKLQGIFVMDSSKRSTKSNAFFTGFGKFRRLVLFDTLIEKQSTEELVAVLAHEIGHFERKHILKSMLLSFVFSAFIFYLFAWFMNNPALFQAFQMENRSTYASIIFVGFLYSPLQRILGIFTQNLSRKYEFEADEFARKTYGRPEMLISALKKLSIDNLSHLTPHPLKVILDYSHPPVMERIRALRFKSE